MNQSSSRELANVVDLDSRRPKTPYPPARTREQILADTTDHLIGAASELASRCEADGMTVAEVRKQLLASEVYTGLFRQALRDAIETVLAVLPEPETAA